MNKMRLFLFYSQNEIEEEEAIRKILEDGRQPLKCQEKVSVYDEKTKKESRRRHYSSDDSSIDSLKERHRSRSRSRSPRRNKKGRRSHSNPREDGELDTSSDSCDSNILETEFRENHQKKRKKKKKGNDYEGTFLHRLAKIISTFFMDSIIICQFHRLNFL